MHGNRKPILNGEVFGRLTVIRTAEPRREGRRGTVRYYVRCECTCGRQTTCRESDLRTGNTTSCGCPRTEMLQKRCRDFLAPLNRTHGLCGHPLYDTWKAMHYRCENPRCEFYSDYGGRGITVCERWSGDSGIVNFIADMGPKPTPQHSIDRYPDYDGPYSPENTRWATPDEQAANKRPRPPAINFQDNRRNKHPDPDYAV